MNLTEPEENLMWSGAMAVGLILAILGLNGCAAKSTQPTADDTIKAGVVDGAIAASKTPLFKMTCAPSCTFASLEVGNPAAAGQMVEIVKVAMQPAPSEASQNFRAVIGVLGQVGTVGLIGHTVSNVFGKISDGYVGMAGKIQAPGAITTTTTNTTTNTATTNTLSGTGVLGSGTYTAPIATNTNPSPKVCVPTFGATGTPTGFVCTGG